MFYPKLLSLSLTIALSVLLSNSTRVFAQNIYHIFDQHIYLPIAIKAGETSDPSDTIDDSIGPQFITVINSSGELNNGQDRSAIDDSGQYGWIGKGECQYINANAQPGNGMWRMTLGSGCEVAQMTHHEIRRGQAFSLLFDASAFAALPDSVIAEIYVQHDGGLQETIVTQRFRFSPLREGYWKPFQLITEYSALDRYAGHTVGIRFRNPTPASQLKWLSVDNVRFEFFAAPTASSATFSDSWERRCDQVWAGENFWSNRLQDWEIRDGLLQTRTTGDQTTLPLRTVHRLSSQINTSPQDLHLQVTTGIVGDHSGDAPSDSFSGILIGAGLGLDYRAAALIHSQPGRNGGIIAAVDHLGRAIIRDNETSDGPLAMGMAPANGPSKSVTLDLTAHLGMDGYYLLQLRVLDEAGELQSDVDAKISAVRMLGNIALVASGNDTAIRHWFDHFIGKGGKLTNIPEQAWGPVLFTTYTLSSAIVTLSAQLAPVCAEQYDNLRLEIKQYDNWHQIAQAAIDPLSHTAQFRISDWDDTGSTEYRVILDEIEGESEVIQHHFSGTIQANPQNKEELVVGVFTCQVMLTGGGIQPSIENVYSWTRDKLVYPHEQLVHHASLHYNDILVFPGDQIYEFQPTDTDRSSPENQRLDYLYKWYLFGWIWRDHLRDIPSIIIPDDHDVYQGNIWGEGGRPTETPNHGGYTEPAEFINMVQRTQTGNLPPPFDPTPIEQGIEVYYTNVVYGGVGFAVLEDRKFKTGPQSDAEELILLGERQHRFLENWVKDWTDQEMKLTVSQTPFANSYTHQTFQFSRIRKNFDSNGWPKTGRDRAVDWLRRAFAPHINGDQHLAITFQHGIMEPADAVYSFTAPSMMNVFPRVWDPGNVNSGRVNRHENYLGPYTDGFGNYLDVLAVANPAIYYRDYSTAQDPVNVHDRGTGYGIIRINKSARTYTFEAWPIYADPLRDKPYPGWPITVTQRENDGRTPVGYLSEISTKVENPIVQVIDEATDEVVYALRIQGSKFTPPIYALQRTYKIEISKPEVGYFEHFTQTIAISNVLSMGAINDSHIIRRGAR